jgi:hypothetical protein
MSLADEEASDTIEALTSEECEFLSENIAQALEQEGVANFKLLYDAVRETKLEASLSVKSSINNERVRYKDHGHMSLIIRMVHAFLVFRDGIIRAI